MKTEASIIIPNFNGINLLDKNLPNFVTAYKNKKNRILEIIIVDDCSTDESYEFIKKTYPFIKVIRHKINRGFAASINTGARASRGKYLVLLNNDVIPKVDFLESVFSHLSKPDVFALSFNEEDYSWAKAFFDKGYIIHQPGPKTDQIHDTFWVSGGSGIFKRDLWMKLGGFDQALFKFYWEDVDLSYRAVKRGYKLLWDNQAKVIHKHGSSTKIRFSTKKLSRMQEKNQLIFIWKNITSPILFKKHLAGLLKRISKHPGYLRIILSALLSIRLILKARKKEKKESELSDEAIFAKFI